MTSPSDGSLRDPRHDAEQTFSGLKQAIASRMVIGEAAGILMEQHPLPHC